MIQQSTCKQHANQKLTLICLNYNCNSNSPCCALCAQSQHKNHQCQLIDELCNYFDNQFINPLEQEILSNLDQQKVSFKQQIISLRKVIQQQIQNGKQIQYLLEQYVNQIKKINTLQINVSNFNEHTINDLSNHIVRSPNVKSDITGKLTTIIQELNNFNPKQLEQQSNNDENLPGYQYYQAMLRDLQENNCQFEDPDFPPNEASCGVEGLWTRVGEYCKKDIKFFTNPKGPNIFGTSHQMEMRDICEGLQGNQLLSQVLYLIANSQTQELKNVFITQDINPHNIYALKLLKDSIEQVVVVDDFIPYSFEYDIPQTLIGQNGAIWIAVLEKAMMKIFGTYLIGLNKPPPSLIQTILCGPTVKEPAASANIMKFIRDELNQQSFLSCYIADKEVVICQILKIEKITHPQLGSVELLQMKTPKDKWWTGDWSYNSPKWTPQLKQQLEIDQKTKIGIIYMDLPSFQRKFPVAYSCRINMKIGNSLLVSQRKNQATYFKVIIKNPGKYSIAVKEEQQFITMNKITLFEEVNKSYTFVDSFYNAQTKQETFTLKQGTYIGYVRVYWEHKEEADVTITINGQRKCEILQIQKIPNLVRDALGKAAKEFGEQFSEQGFSQYILEMPLKGWNVLYLHNQSSIPVAMQLPPHPHCKLMKPHVEGCTIQVMPGQSEIIVGKVLLQVVRTNDLDNIVITGY